LPSSSIVIAPVLVTLPSSRVNQIVPTSPGSFVLGDHTTGSGRPQAGVLAIEAVVVRAVPAEAGELLGPYAGLQLG
jgi:hypothetical protein